MFRLAIGLLAVPVIAALARAEEARPKVSKEDLAAILEKARKDHDVPALGAAVVTSRGLVELAVVGVRKRGTDVAAKESDLFHLGSNTKAMTATLMARLIQKKLLRYDSTLAEIFPRLGEKMTDDLGGVTLGQCLTHQGGLPANLEWWPLANKGDLPAQRRAAVRELLETKLPGKPGKKFLYSNTGYVVAAAMAERVTKKSWESLLADEVARPLKMKVGHGVMGRRGRVEQPWQHDEKGRPMEPVAIFDNPAVLGPAGNVHCSLADWAKFIADQLAGARGKDGLLAAAAYKALHAPADKGEIYTRGGWGYSTGYLGVILQHDGSNGSNFASAELRLKDDVAVLVVCNQGRKPGQKATHDARAAIMKKWLGK